MKLKLSEDEIEMIAQAVLKRLAPIERTDWSKVDFSKPDSVLSHELDLNPATVHLARYRMGLPRMRDSKLSKVDWDKVDWSKTNGEIGAELGIPAPSVRSWRLKLGKPLSTRTSRERTITEDMIQKADWLNTTDRMLSRAWRVSRERIRQIRQERKLPQCRFKHMNEANLKFIRWAEENRAKLENLRSAEILAQSPTNLSRPTKNNLLKSLGFAVQQGCQKYPHDRMNWELPNVLLTMVWGAPENVIASQRYRSRWPKARWWVAGHATRDCYDSDLRLAVESEIVKAEKLGFHPDRTTIGGWFQPKAA